MLRRAQGSIVGFVQKVIHGSFSSTIIDIWFKRNKLCKSYLVRVLKMQPKGSPFCGTMSRVSFYFKTCLVDITRKLTLCMHIHLFYVPSFVSLLTLGLSCLILTNQQTSKNYSQDSSP
ncbi:hypothetical protein BpHYR1_035204 [Brachionus plicatilis]|uniref:Uncharacterized protein n=1 Tax=Brachionus plicatilis TaxID=10195 RepID=A0A3M7TAG2_BRAPC|nr:hypothetical protein BpHYR1_035204 [Brachionus plicatilis]